MRTVVRSTLITGMTGTLMVSAAWAGIGISPLPVPSTAPEVSGPGTAAVRDAGGVAAGAVDAVTAPTATTGDQLLVGAAKSPMTPRPGDMAARFPGARWETDPAQCQRMDQTVLSHLDKVIADAPDGIVTTGSPWHENPNCIYMGGFGIGPSNPVKAFDTELGLWVRSIAMSKNGTPFVMTVIDAEGWLWDYKSKCTDCGAKQISAALAADPELTALGAKPESFILHATHSHSGPDFIGGWGFVPNWYMAQITDTIKATAKQALLNMQPATLETGEIEARAFNSERRDTYRAAEEQSLAWLRAVAVPAADAKKKDAPEVIATLGAYAAHPTTRGTNGGVASSDWVGFFEKRLEDRFGGIGLHFMTGLGNMSASGGTGIGARLADLLPATGTGTLVTSPDVRLARTTYRSPITNAPLDALGTPGFFDRKFDAIPAAVSVGENPNAPCVSASPQSVELPITVAKIGSQIVFSTGAGEEFSNLSNTIKEKNAGRVTFPLAQVNDALGYMPQSFEINRVGQQALGFAFGGYVFVNYEDSYAIDACVGDGMLETTLAALSKLK
ncbi:MAG: hypothetical protein LC789_05530 [Actinobacteria bacterium]|nr:hypothetical protein [Actinomycetota bacterium]MCA1721438.1 hypothetical protein [Actinomycetota bacterium]